MTRRPYVVSVVMFIGALLLIVVILVAAAPRMMYCTGARLDGERVEICRYTGPWPDGATATCNLDDRTNAPEYPGLRHTRTGLKAVP